MIEYEQDERRQAKRRDKERSQARKAKAEFFRDAPRRHKTADTIRPTSFRTHVLPRNGGR